MAKLKKKMISCKKSTKNFIVGAVLLYVRHQMQQVLSCILAFLSSCLLTFSPSCLLILI